MKYKNVLKFGGTSVGTARRVQTVAGLISRESPVVVVLSAMTGTTNALVEIANHLYRGERQDALAAIQRLEAAYAIVTGELYFENEIAQQAEEFLLATFAGLRSFVPGDFHPLQEKAIVATGEIISTHLMFYYLQEQEIPVTLLPALDFMRVDKDGEPDYFYIKQNLDRLLDEPDVAPLVITQGFICRDAAGEINNLKRGGSDYSAAIIGSVLGVDEIQIWTDVDGVRDNDPRYVPNTRPARLLSFDEAAELAYFGAKILHPSSILPAKRANIPVRLKNTLNPADEGTLVTAESPASDFKAVAAKDGITVIKIKSSNMLLAYGFVRKVFEVFETWKTPIDTIVTSEVAISLTIDDTSHLEQITAELERYGTIEIEHDLSIICVVGDFRPGRPGVVARVLQALGDIPPRVISYGASEHSVSLLVKRVEKRHALVALGEELFTK
ncbi:MAG: aspartate kinase [Odoribacteraceae bacterium]|jgi:aspartate kinase|nr:aspartate kinase [Odoribacteraceae bacterium]